MIINVLGTGNAFNQESRLNSSFLVKHNALNFLIDCGFTVPLALQNQNICFSSVDYLLITHYHGDHFAGIAAFLLGLKYVYPQTKKLTIVGPHDPKNKVEELLKILYPGNENVINELNLHFMAVPEKGGSVFGKDFEIHVHQMIHTDETFPVGYILKWETNSLGFTGDTCWHEGLIDFINQSDQVIMECNFVKKVGEAHISVEELEFEELVQEKKSNIFLTHLYEGSSAKAKELGYNVLSDGDVLNFES